MSDKARYIGGSQSGVDITVPLDNGEDRVITIPQGGELPTEIDGVKVPAGFRDLLLEQKDNWTRVKRPATKPAEGAKEGEQA